VIEMRGRRLTDYIEVEDRDILRFMTDGGLDDGAVPGPFEAWVRVEARRRGLMSWSCVVILDGEIGTPMVVATGFDISARRETETALRESEERFRRMFDDAPTGIAMYDPELRFLRVNSAYCSLTGYSKTDLARMTVLDFTHQEDVETSRIIAERLFAQRAQSIQFEKRYMRKDGREIWVCVNATVIRSADHPAILCIYTDVTDRRNSEAWFRREALRDPLTGLANRALFLEAVEQAIRRHKAHPEYNFAVLFVDIDGFKPINDRYGHAEGDHLLRSVADRLRRCLDSRDIVARVGGDEFAILLDDVRDWRNPKRIAARIHRELGLPTMIGGEETTVTVSIGIAMSCIRHERPDTLLRLADAAMYKAKASGKACSVVFEGM
jgi:diguanylate cyclase (GGDEF)-like protein/PAS domain S-box-containing protein